MADFKYLEKTLTNYDCFTLKVKALQYFTASHPWRSDSSATNINVQNSGTTIYGNIDAAIKRTLKQIKLREHLSLFCPESSIFFLSI